MQANALDMGQPAAEPGLFRVDVHRERETVRVAPVGELDLASVDELRRCLDELRGEGFGRVVLDLRGLTFIDSSGLHLMIEWAQPGREPIEFAIIQGPRPVRRVFELAGLLDRLPFASA